MPITNAKVRHRSCEVGEPDSGTINRREFLLAVGVSAGGMLLGCVGENGSGLAASSPEPSQGAGAPVPVSDEGTVAASAPGPIGPFRLSSETGGVDLPFAFGHGFRQGDVPAGNVAVGDIEQWQCSPLTWWPDGSLKHSIIAGRCTLGTGHFIRTINLGYGPPSAKRDLTVDDLRAALPADTSASVGGTTMSLAGPFLDNPHRTVCSGPVMSNWIYRLPVTGSAHLVIWADLRCYSGGAVEIFPWVENGHLLAANPLNSQQTCIVRVAGSTRFSESIDIKHHTRVPLLRGSNFNYWTGSDPQVVPRHDRSYLMKCRLVPNYGWTSPSNSTLDALNQTYEPNTLSSVSKAMGNAGNSGSLIRTEHALYITTGGDPRAYRAAMVFGLSSGSWSIHHRDEMTYEPFKYSSYPNISTNIQGSPIVPVGQGSKNGTEAYSHLPSFGYTAFLLTGRWWFLEECLFWVTSHYLASTADQRSASGISGASHIIDPTRGINANRGAHWALRDLAQSLALLPVSHPLHPDLRNAWEQNTAFYRGKFVDGTIDSGAHVSPQGFLGDFSEGGESLYSSRIRDQGLDPGNHWWGAAWMSAFGVQVWGFASDLGLPQSQTSLSNQIAVRDHAYKQVVARADDGLDGRFNWRRFIQYDYPIGGDGSGFPPEVWYTASESFSIYEAAFRLPSVPSTEGLTLLDRYSNEPLQPFTSASMTYGPQQLAGLAYAVDHASPGAADGWRRLETSANFASAFEGLHNEPEHAFAPRG